MFHVELRQFPHQARAFNLTREELDAQLLRPWAAGNPVELEDRRWTPGKARFTIYEAPRLAPEQLGLGRGWSNVTRSGEDVTERLLAELAHPPPVAELKRAVLSGCDGGPVPLARLIELTAARYPQSRVSERLALCEQAVWELLHEGGVALARGRDPVAREDWQDVLLRWETWAGDGVVLERAGAGA